jgi:hypothetical protein
MKNIKLYYHLIITFMFVYIFIQFLTLKNTNYIYKFYTDYIMNKYCIIIYISLLFCIAKYDTYTAILLFILIIGPFKCSTKEFYENNTTLPNTTLPNIEQKAIDKIVKDNLLGIDDRFKMDDIKKDEILRQIKAQIQFDPYKTNLSKDVISEIYNKYFDNDIFVKLKSIDNDSKEYIASGNFNYVPKENKVDYDITTYENLTKNSLFGINANIDTNKSIK